MMNVKVADLFALAALVVLGIIAVQTQALAALAPPFAFAALYLAVRR